jgi:sarcosine oxidase subunit beta
MGKIVVPNRESLPETCDVVVIGGGIVGVASAFWLSRAGLDTVLVEMRDGLSTLTTPNSVECFRAQFTEPAMSALATQSIEIFENFSEIIGIPDYDISMHRRGYLFVSDDPGMTPQIREAVEKHHSLGVNDSEFLDAEQLQERFPYLSENVAAGTFRQKDGWLSSHEATQGFARGSDALFLVNTRATGIKVDAGGVCAVETQFGTISTRTIVNAAGPFAGVVGKMVGLDLPLEPVRRQKAFIASDEIPQDAPMTIDLRRDAYWRPEVGGGYIGWVDPDEPVGKPSEDLPTDKLFAAYTLEKLSYTCPFWVGIAEGLKASDVVTSAGQYVYTPDDQPLIGETPEVPGFYLNCGYWAGVMLSAGAGKRVADLVIGAMKADKNPLRPTRYREGIVIEGDSFLRGRH